MMSQEPLEESFKNLDLSQRLAFIAARYPADKIAFSTSFGQEDQAILHALAGLKLGVRVFTLDTGRLFQESYDLMDLSAKKYAYPIETYVPNAQDLQALIAQQGHNGFYHSVDQRKACCQVRKMEPLGRALANTEVWITGLRAEQSENRAQMPFLEWDAKHQLMKFNPLMDWTFQQLLNYLNENRIPQNPLHQKGFVSIGCAPCTRAIQEGEHPRAGRWWWEDSKKECGLHE